MRMKGVLIAAWLLLAPAPVWAEDELPSRDEQLMLQSAAFLNAHPDMKHRLQGWQAYEAGRLVEAIEQFRKAARYADKLSQAMLAEMFWNGQGTPADRSLAYAWADLAAERGHDRFLALRERYWQGLDATGRAEAVARGRPLLAEYGDAVARPRMAKYLRKARWTMSSGMIHRNASIYLLNDKSRPLQVKGDLFYAARYWEPERYQEWKREILTREVPTGTVTVQDPETVRDAPSGADGEPAGADR